MRKWIYTNEKKRVKWNKVCDFRVYLIDYYVIFKRYNRQQNYESQ